MAGAGTARCYYLSYICVPNSLFFDSIAVSGLQTSYTISDDVLSNQGDIITKHVKLRIAHLEVEFNIATRIEQASNGSILIVTRSVPSTGKENSSTRGIVYCNAFLIHSRKERENGNSVMDFAFHMDSNAVSTAVNYALQTDILARLIKSIQHVQNYRIYPSSLDIKFLAVMPDESVRLKETVANVVETLSLLAETNDNNSWRILPPSKSERGRDGIRVSEFLSDSSKGLLRATVTLQVSSTT